MSFKLQLAFEGVFLFLFIFLIPFCFLALFPNSLGRPSNADLSELYAECKEKEVAEWDEAIRARLEAGAYVPTLISGAGADAEAERDMQGYSHSLEHSFDYTCSRGRNSNWRSNQRRRVDGDGGAVVSSAPFTPLHTEHVKHRSVDRHNKQSLHPAPSRKWMSDEDPFPLPSYEVFGDESSEEEENFDGFSGRHSKSKLTKLS